MLDVINVIVNGESINFEERSKFFPLKNQHKTYLTNTVSTNSNKLLWHYVKSQRQDKTGITASKDPTYG